MKVYVTGASGFVGGHVVRELRAAGAEVRDEWIDLLDRDRLRRAIGGCDAVFHLAALYSYDAPESEHQRVNVEGTRVVVELCQELDVPRLVHTSTAGTCGPVPGRAANEEDSPPDWELDDSLQAHEARGRADRPRRGADRARRRGRQPDDAGRGRRPLPDADGRMIESVAAGRYRAFVDTGLNVVDVRDVASGHVLAFERGRPGERYILGGADLTLEELFGAVADLADARAQASRALPGGAALARGGLANAHEVLLARVPMYFSWGKAARELGYSPGPVGPALARAVREALERTRLFSPDL